MVDVRAMVVLVALACVAAAAVTFQWGQVPPNASAALCAFAEAGDRPYVDEWIAYHLRLGVDAVYLYDTSDGHELRDAPTSWPGRVRVTHLPGGSRLGAYQACLAASRGRHTWLGFLDVDEFLVLRRHDTIKSLLREHCPTGGLALNRLSFGSGGAAVYEHRPVRERFLVRERDADDLVKTIVRVRDAASVDNPHVATMRPGAVTRDTSGRAVAGAVNPRGPTDVAVVHRYTRSDQEYAARHPGAPLPPPPAHPVYDTSALA